jgi:hypothetical protein
MTINTRLLTFALTIAFALLIPQMASAQGFGAREDNTALNGTTLTYYPRPSVDQCQSDCANNGNCRGFTWIQAGTYNPRDSAMCYLISAVTGRASARGHISAVKGGGGGNGGGVSIGWGTQADGKRGQNGQRFTFSCPSGGAGNRAWGTGIYTDDSSICVSAVHAGLITFASGGTVSIEIRPGQASYTGSQRNGVSSSSYGSWHGSFVFVR